MYRAADYWRDSAILNRRDRRCLKSAARNYFVRLTLSIHVTLTKEAIAERSRGCDTIVVPDMWHYKRALSCNSPTHKRTDSRDASDKIINRPRRFIESAIPSERLADAAVRINYSRCFAMRNADDCLSLSFDQRADAPVIEFADIIGRTRARRIATVIAAVSSGKQDGHDPSRCQSRGCRM